MIQLLPVFIPVLVVLDVIRFSNGSLEHPVLTETWAQMMIAGVILIGAIWMMFYTGLK
jgi:hypothetical protein